MKNFYFSLLLAFIFFILTGCYTKNDLIQRQIERDKFPVTVVTTKQGESYMFRYRERRLVIKGDYLNGTLIDGTYKTLSVSDISMVNKIPFETKTPIYLYVIFGLGFLGALWYAATKV